MPIVHIAMRAHVASELCEFETQSAFTEIAQELLAHPDRKLEFNFFPALIKNGPQRASKLTEDIVIEVQLNADEARVAAAKPDFNAASIAIHVSNFLLNNDGIEASVGVGLCHSIMGWGTADTRKEI